MTAGGATGGRKKKREQESTEGERKEVLDRCPEAYKQIYR